MSEANEQRCPPQPLIKPVDRNQYLLRACHVERLIPENHPARDIWETVGRLDLSHFYEDIKSNTQQGGRSATDPRLLISLWIYAYRTCGKTNCTKNSADFHRQMRYV